ANRRAIVSMRHVGVHGCQQDDAGARHDVHRPAHGVSGLPPIARTDRRDSTTMPDRNLMQRALLEAHQAIGVSEPNPRVGCVIASTDGKILALGHTQEAGGPHAEVAALCATRKTGHDCRDATAYVTLEPCSHYGRTPPCCDAFIDAGVARVVIAVQDPNPLVAGQGIARLRAAGIAVDVVDGEWGEASRE